MGIFKKIGDLARANLNEWLNQLEDREKLAKQKILDLEDSKKKAHKLLVAAMAAVKLAEQHKARIKRRLDIKEQTETDNTEQEKQNFIRESATYDETIEKEQETISTINSGLKAIDEEISIIKNASSSEIARETIENSDALDTFSRMEEKIEMREQEVQALRDLLAESENSDDIKGSSFDKYSDPAALESELDKMKKKIKK